MALGWGRLIREYTYTVVLVVLPEMPPLLAGEY